MMCPWLRCLQIVHVFNSPCLYEQENSHTVPGNVTLWSYDFDSKVRWNETPNIDHTLNNLPPFHIQIILRLM